MNLRDVQLEAMEYPCSAGGTYEGHHVETFNPEEHDKLTGALPVHCTKCRRKVWIHMSSEDSNPYVSHVSPYGV